MSSNEVNEMTTDSPTEDPKQLYRSETKTSIERHTVNKFDTEDEHEGGFWAWATVVSAFLLQCTGFGYSNAYGVYQDFYVREFLTTSTSSQISWIGSTQSFLMLTMGIFTGPLFDRGYCYHLIITGSILLISCLFLLSLAQPEKYYQVFLVQGLGVGIGSSLTYLPSMAVLAHHFKKPHTRARAMCIAVAGSSFGGLLHPIMLNYLFHRSSDPHADFVLGVRASAGVIAGLQVISILLLRTKYPNKNGDEIDSNATLEVTSEGSPHEKKEDRSSSRGLTNFGSTVKKFASDWPYVSMVFGLILYEMVFFFPCFYLQLDAITHGLNSSFAFFSLSILNGSSFVGRLVPGFFAKRFGVANMFLFSTFCVTIMMFCFVAVRTVTGVVIFAVLYGFFSGCFVTLMSPLLAQFAESPGELGARMGLCFAFTGMGSLIGTPISGALLTKDFIWWRPIIFNGLLCLTGFCAFTICRILLGRRNGATWII